MPNHSAEKSEGESPENQTLSEEIEELAELQFSKQECAVIAQCKKEELDSGELFLAYTRGRLRAQAEVRRAMLQMAKQGSTPAQKQFSELVAQSSNDNANKNDFDFEAHRKP